MPPGPFLPLADLGAQHRDLREPIQAALARVLEGSGFVLGEEVEAFEREVAEYLGVRHAIGVASGTDALHLALRAAGIGPGDEVILPAWTFLATASAVVMAGATPVFAEIDPATFHLDPESARARVGARTRALVPVHLYGQPVDLAPFRELAERHALFLLEDACQAHGARLPDGRRAGAGGDAGCFSFYPSKNLGGIGDGGLVVTGDDRLAASLRRLRNHGQTRKYEHVELGWNSRLDAVQAAVLRVKLPRLDAWNRRRRELAERYREGLSGLPLEPPRAVPGRDHVWHVFVVRARERDALQAHLAAAGIGTVIHYPTPVHLQLPFRGWAPEGGALARSEALGSEVLSLPLFPEMTDGQVERVVAAVRSFYA